MSGLGTFVSTGRVLPLCGVSRPVPDTGFVSRGADMPSAEAADRGQSKEA